MTLNYGSTLGPSSGISASALTSGDSSGMSDGGDARVEHLTEAGGMRVRVVETDLMVPSLV